VGEITFYATRTDADRIRRWINAEDAVAWIVLDAREGTTYRWKAVDVIDTIEPQDYALWHKSSTRINIPARSLDVRDTIVLDPYQGWLQELEEEDETTPWFGDSLPGPYQLHFREEGREKPGSLARSGFFWLGDHFRMIGQGASPDARRWWNRLRRWVRKESTAIPWPFTQPASRSRAYAFPDAYTLIQSGRHPDVNP